MPEAGEAHGDTCGCQTCKRARKAVYNREYARRRAESDPEWLARRGAKARAAQRERMASDPEYAAQFREHRRQKVRERCDRDPEAYRAHRAKQQAEWRANNRERSNEATRRLWHRHPEYREYHTEKYRLWRARATPVDLEQKRTNERVRSPRYRERRRVNGKLWRERNRERWLALLTIKNANRRAREKMAGGSWMWEQFQSLCFLIGNRCSYCGCVPDKLTPDHAIPLARGGSNDITNIVPACLPCNLRKGTRTADEFIARLMEESQHVQ